MGRSIFFLIFLLLRLDLVSMFLIFPVCLVCALKGSVQNVGNKYYQIAFKLPKVSQKEDHNSYETQMMEFQN